MAPVTSKAVPSVFASSVCWALQCLISALTQGGRWWTLFSGSLVQSRCGEGGMLQTNNTGMCSQCLSHAGHAPAHGTHRSGSTLLRQELSEAGPRLHAAPWSKQLRLGSQVALRGADSLGLRFVPFPGPRSSGVWRAQSLRLVAFSCCSVLWVYRWRPL